MVLVYILHNPPPPPPRVIFLLLFPSYSQPVVSFQHGNKGFVLRSDSHPLYDCRESGFGRTFLEYFLCYGKSGWIV